MKLSRDENFLRKERQLQQFNYLRFGSCIEVKKNFNTARDYNPKVTQQLSSTRHKSDWACIIIINHN